MLYELRFPFNFFLLPCFVFPGEKCTVGRCEKCMREKVVVRLGGTPYAVFGVNKKDQKKENENGKNMG